MKEDKRFTRIIPKPIEKLFVKLREGSEYLDYGRDIIVKMVNNYINANCNKQKLVSILDIGAGSGTDLNNIKNKIKKNTQLFAVETFDPNLRKLNELEVKSYNINIEKDCLPFEDSTLDIVIANQVIEHTKEIFFIFSEISRVLKKNGAAIVGFPNLAALHNRFLLLLGEQPICIRMPGPHVRGITKGGFYQFVTTDDYFKVKKIAGSNFYPFPPGIAKKLATFFPSFSISLYFLCQRTSKRGQFIDVLTSRFYETNYFTGPKKICGSQNQAVEWTR